MIHQHFMLVEQMSVAENVMLGWDEAGWWLDGPGIAEKIGEASGRLGLELDPAQLVARLSLGERQRVEILKAVMRGADLLVLDEPTSNLSPPEIKALLGLLRRLKADGKGIIFISHKLAEVMAVCDEVVVLRDGRVSGRREVGSASEAELAAMMIDRELSGALARSETAEPGRVLLSVRGLDLRRNGGPGLTRISHESSAHRGL